MTHFRRFVTAGLLTLSLTTFSYAGTITGSKTGTSAARVGTITGSRAGTITGSRTGTITGSRVGTITGSRVPNTAAFGRDSLAASQDEILFQILSLMMRASWWN